MSRRLAFPLLVLLCLLAASAFIGVGMFFARGALPPGVPPVAAIAAAPAESAAEEVETLAPGGEDLDRLLGYPQVFSSEVGAPTVLRFGGRTKTGDARIVGVRVTDVVTGATVLVRDGLDLPVQSARCVSYRGKGCDFPDAITLNGAAVPRGLYGAVLVASDGSKSQPIFFNKRPDPGTADLPRFAVLLPTFTWAAYNDIGGAMLHGAKTERREVSLARPQYLYEWPLAENHNTLPAVANVLRFLAGRGDDFLTLTSLDLHEGASLFADIDLLMLTIHDEYWTAESRNHLESYLNRGGRLLVVGGNTCWWKAVYRDGVLSVDKSNRNKEGEFGERLGYWHHPYIDKPCEETFGLTYRGGGVPVRRRLSTAEEAAAAGVGKDVYEASDSMEVLEPGHPIFTGLDLSAGARFGGEIPLVNTEIDGLPLTAAGEIDRAEFPLAPSPLRQIAAAYTYKGGAVRRSLSIAEFLYRDRGRVLNLGTHGWYIGLRDRQPLAETVVGNAVDYMMRAPVPVPDKP